MRRKILSLLLVMTMGMTLLAGCGGSDSTNDEVDKNAASESLGESEAVSSEMTGATFFEVNSISGTKVKVYYDPNVIASASTLWEPEFSVTDVEGNVYNFVIGDFDTAEDYFMRRIDEFNSIQSKTNEEFSEPEEYGMVGENTIMQYTLEYDQISTDDNNNPVYTPVSYSECIIELGSVVVCFDNTEEQKFWDVLATMKFVVGNENDTENNQNDNNGVVVEGNLQTLEFPACVEGQTGVITYNGDFVEVTDSDKINGADFDIEVIDGKTTYITGVTLSVNTCGIEEEIQDEKEWMEAKAKSFQFSEIKETTINKIPVQYYSCTYTTEREGRENEHKSFKCVIEFPTIKEYYDYTIMLSLYSEKEETLILSALENLLVDVELLGVKPLGVGEAVVGNDEFYDPWYDETCLTTPDGKNVNIYFVGEGGLSWEAEPEVPSSVYIYDKNQDMCYFSVSDAATPEEYANNMIQWNDYLEIGTQEEIQLAGRTIHKYHFVDKETGDVFISAGVIQLASDVVFTFTDKHMKYSESGLEEVLEALRFVVE